MGEPPRPGAAAPIGPRAGPPRAGRAGAAGAGRGGAARGAGAGLDLLSAAATPVPAISIAKLRAAVQPRLVLQSCGCSITPFPPVIEAQTNSSPSAASLSSGFSSGWDR